MLNLKFLLLLEYQNIKAFLQTTTFQTGLKKFSELKKLKTLFHGHMLLVISKAKKLLECFTKKEFRVQKVIL